MSKPKTALEQAITWWPVDGDDKILAKLLAAIPVAELHEQAVELLGEINPYLTEETYRKIIALRDQIKALK